MNTLKNLLSKYGFDIAVIALFAVISFAYFMPADIEGRILYRHDSSAGRGAGQEQQLYLEQTGERTMDKLYVQRYADLSDSTKLWLY